MELPDDLRVALEIELQAVSSRDLARRAGDLSQRYRAGHSRSSEPFLHSGQDVSAYAAFRFPATFAAAAATLAEVRDCHPTFEPHTVLDVGGGPGTATWAALQIWPSIERATILERDARMIRLGRRLAARARYAAVRQAEWRQSDILADWDVEPVDLTVATYLFGELPADAQGTLLRRFWEHTLDTCVIVEPGTPRGFRLIRQAGDALHDLGAHLIAPFPHGWQCVESDDDWCHFSERVPRTRIHRAVKGGALSYEDEKFSYVAASWHPGTPIAARVIRHPQVRSGHIRLVLCTAAGVWHIVVTRSNRDAYRRAKDLAWGDALLREEAPLFGLDAPS